LAQRLSAPAVGTTDLHDVDKGDRDPLWAAPDAVINEHVKEVIEGDLDGFTVGHPHAGVQPLLP
jgi:hypothetical protein